MEDEEDETEDEPVDASQPPTDPPNLIQSASQNNISGIVVEKADDATDDAVCSESQQTADEVAGDTEYFIVLLFSLLGKTPPSGGVLPHYHMIHRPASLSLFVHSEAVVYLENGLT